MFHTAKKMKFSIKDFLSKCDQITFTFTITITEKSLMENFIFCAVLSGPTKRFLNGYSYNYLTNKFKIISLPLLKRQSISLWIVKACFHSSILVKYSNFCNSNSISGIFFTGTVWSIWIRRLWITMHGTMNLMKSWF